MSWTFWVIKQKKESLEQKKLQFMVVTSYQIIALKKQLEKPSDSLNEYFVLINFMSSYSLLVLVISLCVGKSPDDQYSVVIMMNKTNKTVLISLHSSLD